MESTEQSESLLQKIGKKYSQFAELKEFAFPKPNRPPDRTFTINAKGKILGAFDGIVKIGENILNSVDFRDYKKLKTAIGEANPDSPTIVYLQYNYDDSPIVTETHIWEITRQNDNAYFFVVWETDGIREMKLPKNIKKLSDVNGYKSYYVDRFHFVMTGKNQYSHLNDIIDGKDVGTVKSMINLVRQDGISRRIVYSKNGKVHRALVKKPKTDNLNIVAVYEFSCIENTGVDDCMDAIDFGQKQIHAVKHLLL